MDATAGTPQRHRRLGHRPDPQLLHALQTPSPQPDVYHLTAAGWLPADADTAGPAGLWRDDAATYPSITVAGAQAFLYVAGNGDGVLVLSLYLDTGEAPDWLTRADRCVPVRVTVNGDEVFTDDRPVLRVAESSSERHLK
jgi:hypothetical protein